MYKYFREIGRKITNVSNQERKILYDKYQNAFK